MDTNWNVQKTKFEQGNKNSTINEETKYEKNSSKSNSDSSARVKQPIKSAEILYMESSPENKDIISNKEDAYSIAPFARTVKLDSFHKKINSDVQQKLKISEKNLNSYKIEKKIEPFNDSHCQTLTYSKKNNNNELINSEKNNTLKHLCQYQYEKNNCKGFTANSRKDLNKINFNTNNEIVAIEEFNNTKNELQKYLMENFGSKKIKDCIYNQNHNRKLQAQLEYLDKNMLDKIFEEIFPSLKAILSHVYGNYFLQCLFQHLNKK